MRKLLVGALMAMLVAVVAACGDDDAGGTTRVEVTSVLSADEAMALADTMLVAYQQGDYATHSASWSSAMKSAIDESAFQASRESVLPVAGDYVGIVDVMLEAADTEGFVRWVFTADFTLEDRVFTLVMRPTDAVIEGAFINPAD